MEKKDYNQNKKTPVIEPEILFDEEKVKDFSEDTQEKLRGATIHLQNPILGRAMALVFLFLFVPILFFGLLYACACTITAGCMLGSHKILNRQMVVAWRFVLAIFGMAFSSVIGLISPIWGIRTVALWLFLLTR